MKQFESFRLDRSNECLWQDGRKIALAPKPFGVLRYLVEHPGRLVTHDELLEALWPETYVQPQVLRTYVLELRKVLGDDAMRPRFIETLLKRGYCFVASVREEEDTRDGAKALSGAQPRLGAGLQGDSVATGAGASQASVLGREEELELLLAKAGLTAAGQRQVVFVTGEAGIGKTALVEDFCRRVVSSRPIRVVRGQCLEGCGSRDRYYPVREALGQLCAGRDGEGARRILFAKAPGWRAALHRGAEAGAGQGAGPAEAGLRSEEGGVGDLCAALEELSAERPLLFVFEDMHWADAATLQLISALARRQADAQMMVVMTDRPQQAAVAERQLKSLKQDLLMRRLCVELALGPLRKAAVEGLLRVELKQQELPEEVSLFVHRHAEGNPLFVKAIVEHLIAQRLLVRVGEGAAALWVQRAALEAVEIGVPAGLAQMIELEMESLSSREQRMLEAGSLSDLVFPAWAVAAALGEDAVEIEEACDALARRAYFLRRCGEDELPDGTRSAFYVFAHGLYRVVLYQRQASQRRARRHVRIADRLRQLFAGREASVAQEMAVHYEAAGEWRSAVDAWRLAARDALRRQARGEAAELLKRSLRVAESLGEPEGELVSSEIRGEMEAVLAGETEWLAGRGRVAAKA